MSYDFNNPPPDTIEQSGLCQIGYHDSCTGYTGPESDPELCECACHEIPEGGLR